MKRSIQPAIEKTGVKCFANLGIFPAAQDIHWNFKKIGIVKGGALSEEQLKEIHWQFDDHKEKWRNKRQSGFIDQEVLPDNCANQGKTLHINQKCRQLIEKAMAQEDLSRREVEDGEAEHQNAHERLGRSPAVYELQNLRQL
jgi:hypothetical protein